MKKVVVTSLLAEGVEFTGDIKSRSSIRIDGVLRGNIYVTDGGGIILGPKGLIEGSVHASGFIVLGRVKGDVQVEHLEIREGGSVEGDIAYKTIEIYKGGRFSGSTSSEPVVSSPSLPENS